MNAVPSDSAYRDARPGAEARRDDLLRRNREALASQPLELRRIAVRRQARSWAGLAVIASASAAAAAAASSSVRSALEVLVPGRMPAIASDLILLAPVAGLLAYFIARAMAEEGFTRAMLATIRAGGDVFDDVERLAISPTEAARDLAREYRARSVAAVAGACAIATPLASLVIQALASAGAWSSPAVIERLAWQAGAPLAQITVASLVLAAAWLSIARGTVAAIRARARRSATVLTVAATMMALLALVPSAEPALFLWVWAAWSAGAAAGLLWASAKIAAEDRV